jgi:hypothetical protein
MMTKPATFEGLLDLWESPTELSAAIHVPYVTAQMMKRRKSVGPAHWQSIIHAAGTMGVELTLEDLAKMKIAATGQPERAA